MDKAVAVIAAVNEILPEKVSEMQSAVGRVYKNFIETYGNMTWEQVAVEIEKMANEKIAQLESNLKSLTTGALVLNGEMIEQAVKMYKDIVSKVVKIAKDALADYEALTTAAEANIMKMTQYMEDKYAQLKPQALEIYKQYSTIVQTEVDRLITLAKKAYADAEGKVKEVYAEIEAIPLKEILVDSILPALMEDFQEIWDQTVTNSIIMAQEITKAYAPFVIIAKDYIEANILPELRVMVEGVRAFLEQYSVENIKIMIEGVQRMIEQKIEDV